MDRRAAAAFVIDKRDASKARAPSLIAVVAVSPTPTALSSRRRPSEAHSGPPSFC